MPSQPLHLASVATFSELTADAIALLEGQLVAVPVARGEAVVSEGDAADRLFVVLSGRFQVEIAGNPEPVTEITRGATIGEIAFFAGGQRTATVRAIRDSVVVALTRADFDAISAQSPGVWSAITSSLAERLAAETRRANRLSMQPGQVKRAGPRARTIALVAAGGGPISPVFLSAFVEAAPKSPIASASGALIVSSATIADYLDGALASADALSALESQTDTLVFVTDPALTSWSERVIRQADEILLVAGNGDQPIAAPIPLSAVEQFARTLHKPAAHRLVIAHRRAHVVQGTRFWLHGRDPAMHHHVAFRALDDMARLWRFLRGEARGFVACGGGAYTAAHIGVYKAFRESGIPLDFYGGASGGAAMAAAFAENLPPEEIEARVGRMFITGKALGRYTLPRYGLIDHTRFDAHLQKEYGLLKIEDMWTPYFAVAVDLDDTSLCVLRSGPVWKAIRASAAIPGLLPPYFTKEGRALVDGSVIANVPIETMHSLKRGPNVIVTFRAPEGRPSAIDYDTLPGRNDLIWRTLNPFARDTLPSAPSAATVLVRSLMANRSHFENYVTPDDWVLMPPAPDSMGALDWRRHRELTAAAYKYATAEIAKRGGGATATAFPVI